MKGFSAKIRLDSNASQNIVGVTKQSAGLIIGTVAEDSSYHVVHFAETFYCNMPMCTSCKSETKSEAEKKADGKSNCHAIFDSVTSKILGYHAQQVVRMLPGGLDIIGVFAVDEKNIFASASDMKVKELVRSLTKPLFKNWVTDSNENKYSKIFMYLNPQTKKWAGKAYDATTTDSKSCDVVEQELNWSRVECEFDTHAAMHVSKADAGAPLKKNLQILVRAFSDSLESAKILINGRLPSEQEIFEKHCDVDTSRDLDAESEAMASGDYAKHSFSTSRSTVHILFDKEPSILRCETPETHVTNRNGSEEETLNHLHVQGKIVVLAIVPEGSSTANVSRRLREDILRSIVSRMQMHCESLIDEESTTEPLHAVHVHHEIPRRVFVTLPDSLVVFSDYLFPGDSPEDSISSFLDILGIDIKDEQSILAEKEPPFSYDIQMGEPVEELLMKEGEEINRTIKSFAWSQWLIAGIVALFLAIALAVTFSGEKSRK